MKNDCGHFDYCSASICPEDPSSLEHCAWFPDEEICRKRHVPEWVKRQKRIARKLNYDFERGCFTKRMLERKAKITSKLHGVDPEKGHPHDQEEKWLKHHPGPSGKPSTTGLSNGSDVSHRPFNGVSAEQTGSSTLDPQGVQK